MSNLVKVSVLETDNVELPYNREVNKDTDLLMALGVSFKGSSDYLIERVGDIIKETYPTLSTKPTYSNDFISAYEVYKTTSQLESNRLMRSDYTYNGDLLANEIVRIFNPNDGVTILRTITYLYYYVGDEVSKGEMSES